MNPEPPARAPEADTSDSGAPVSAGRDGSEVSVEPEDRETVHPPAPPTVQDDAARPTIADVPARPTVQDVPAPSTVQDREPSDGDAASVVAEPTGGLPPPTAAPAGGAEEPQGDGTTDAAEADTPTPSEDLGSHGAEASDGGHSAPDSPVEAAAPDNVVRDEPPRRVLPGVEELAVTAPTAARVDVEPPTVVDASGSPADADLPLVAPPETRQRDATVICITNQKGGVGKTTTTVSLGAALADAGYDVLIIDLDPQGNATTGLGLRVTQGAPSTYRVVVEQYPIEDAAEPTAVRRLHIVPSSLDLAGAEIELVPQFSREGRLKAAIDTIRDEYDVILIDCPPSLGLLTVNALVSADQVLVPIQCEYYALEGLGQLLRTVEMVRSSLNQKLELGGVLMTMYDARTNLSQQVVDEVREHFGPLAFQAVIPRTVRLSEAPSYGQPITAFDPTSRGSRSYQHLAREVAERLGLAEAAPTSALDALLGPVSSTNAPESSESADSPPVWVSTANEDSESSVAGSDASAQQDDQFHDEQGDADHSVESPRTQEAPSWPT